MLTSEKLLAGSSVCFEVLIPMSVLQPDLGDSTLLTDKDGKVLSANVLSANVSASQANKSEGADQNRVRLRPLTIGDLQLINRAAKDKDSLMAALMVQTSLVEPAMTLVQVNRLPVGVLQFLLNQVNEISGINASEDQLRQAAEEPLARAAFILAKNFGWTPQQVGELTLGQVLFNLNMLRQGYEQEA